MTYLKTTLEELEATGREISLPEFLQSEAENLPIVAYTLAGSVESFKQIITPDGLDDVQKAADKSGVSFRMRFFLL